MPKYEVQYTIVREMYISGAKEAEATDEEEARKKIKDEYSDPQGNDLAEYEVDREDGDDIEIQIDSVEKVEPPENPNQLHLF